jgi:shikimate kinase
LEPVNIVLIGLRGTGKTVCGKLLAQRLRWPFVDTDEVIQERSGMNIREIFAGEGEAGFREREVGVVRETATADRTVIATGGGAILDPRNVAALRDRGFVVHLAAHPETLWKRILTDRQSPATRPVLTRADGGLAEIKGLFHDRAGAYCAARDVEVSVEHRAPEQVVSAILLLLRVRGIQAP